MVCLSINGAAAIKLLVHLQGPTWFQIGWGTVLQGIELDDPHGSFQLYGYLNILDAI